MRDQQLDALNDDLAREVEQALSVDPSLEFHARVRERLAHEPALTESAFAWWRLAVRPAAALAAIVVVAVAGWQLGPLSQSTDERARVEQPLTDLQPSLPLVASREPLSLPTQGGPRREGARRVKQQPTVSTIDWLAPVVVAEDEIAGMRALIADAQAGRFEMVVVTEEATAAVTAPVAAAPVAGADVPAAASSESAPTSSPGANAAELTRADAGHDVPAVRPTHLASAHAVRPLVIEPVTITPLVQSLPDEGLEGAAE